MEYAPDESVRSAVRRAFECHSYTAIVGRYLLPTVKAGVLDETGPRVPVILDVDDLDTQVYRTRISAPGLAGWKRHVICRHLAQLERIVAELLPKFDHLWIASPADVALVEPLSVTVSVLPNVPYSIPDRPLFNAAKTCHVLITVGSWTHRVNIDGADHFIRMHWPQVRESYPRAVYRLIGSGMSERLRARWSSFPGVEPIGQVDNIGEAYAQAAAAVVPVYEGAGSKIKVLEALAFGRAVVVTPHALRGYGHVLKDRESILVVHSEAEFASACVEVLVNIPLRDKIAAGGRALVRQFFTPEVAAREVRTTLERVCPAIANQHSL